MAEKKPATPPKKATTSRTKATTTRKSPATSRQKGPTPAELARDTKCLELWRAGASFDAIAGQVKAGLTPEEVADACLRALHRSPQVSQVELRQLEVDRLDRLQMALWPRAVRGDLPAVKAYLDIAALRAKFRAESKPNERLLQTAYDQAVASSTAIEDVDAALVASGRAIAERIDAAVSAGEGQEVTKALYLTPHMVNILRELLATPASRRALEAGAAGAKGAEEEGTSGRLAKLRAVESQRRGRSA